MVCELILGHLDIGLITVRAALACVFLLGALGKVRNWPAFRRHLAQYEIVPRRLERGTAIAVVALELTVVAGLTTGRHAALGSVLAIALIALFSAVVVSKLIAGRTDLRCGCFGMSSENRIGWYILLRNSGFLVLAVADLTGLRYTGISLTLIFFAFSVLLLRGRSRKRSMYSFTPVRNSMNPSVTVSRKISVETAQKA